jgi:hypothetical protein
VRATSIDGGTFEGVWQGLGSDNALKFQADDGSTVSLQPDEVMLLRFPGEAATQPSVENGFTFFLADAGRFGGIIQSGGNKKLTVSTPLIERVEVPLSSLAGIRFARNIIGEAEEVFVRAMTERSASEDVLVNLNAGRVTAIRGATEQITTDGGSFRWRDRTVPFRSDVTYGIVFARGVQSAEPAPVRCLLRDGSIWTGELLEGDASGIELRSSLGPMLRLSLAGLAEVRFRSGRVLLLSDLQPSEYQFEPFAVTQWPYRRNRSVANVPLRLGGQVFEHGLGMHSQSRLTYDLKEGYRELAATIGIDDSVRPRGNVVFRVVADGKEIFSSGPLSGRDPPRAILVPLGQPKRLELHVDFGEGLDVADHANWGQIRLIR